MLESIKKYRRKQTSLYGLLLLLGISLFTPLQAETEPAFEIVSAEAKLFNKVYHINAHLRYRFSDEALDALKNGVPLLILIDIEVEQERKWWFNKEVASLEQGYLLLYHALSEKFIVHNLNSGTQENYASLDSALNALGNIHELPVLDERLLVKGESYQFAIKSYLDIESLPAPMRPLAYISSQWQLESDWYTWTLNL